MDPLRIYDYLAQARARVFDGVRPLSGDEYTRAFPIGPGTLGKILTHIMISEWYYVQRLQKRDVPPYSSWPINQEDPPSFAVLEPAWIEQADATRTALRAVGDWNAELVYTVTEDEPAIITTTAADLFTQLALHEVHHRAQVLNILRQLGAPVEDLDFNAMMYRRTKAAP